MRSTGQPTEAPAISTVGLGAVGGRRLDQPAGEGVGGHRQGVEDGGRGLPLSSAS